MSTSNRTTAATRSSRTRMVSAIFGAFVAVLLSVLGVGVVASAADRVDISITDTLSPANVTIAVGTTVTWTNNDTQQHELRSTSGPVEFRTDTLDPGQSATFTFATPGTYTYVDHRNTGSAAYQGTIVVSDTAPPATVPPGPGTPPPPVTTPPAPLTASVHLAGARFAPATVTVAVGATVTWVNDDGSKHTVTADNASFDSGSLNAGASFVHTFTIAGTYAYGCDFHGNMRGTVIVTGANGAPTPPPATVPPATVPPATLPPAANPPAATPPAAPGAPAAPSNVSVNIANNQFSPSTITISAGSTVTWSNADTVTHTVTADDQSFASGLVKKATSWSHTFTTPGTFTYFCEIHPEMTGTVIATAPNGTAPPAAAAVTSGTPTGSVTAAGSTTSSGTTGATASTGAASGSITISDAGFAPASFHVAVGGTVTFANNGKAMHTVTAGNGSFDSDMIKSGSTWAHTFTTAGSFTYACILHPNMRGTINVGSAGGGGSGALQTEATVASPAPGTGSQADSAAAAVTDSPIQPVNVDVADNEFKPNPATVAMGGTVTWKLVGAAAHTVTADDQSFNSGLLKPGETFQHTFTTLGSFTYACLVHPGMTGTIEVVPPEQAAAAQTAAPVSGSGGPQAQQSGGQPVTIAATDPPKSTSVWGNTLLGIAAVLVACCVLVFTLKSFLKVLGEPEQAGEVPGSSDGLRPHAI